MKIRLLSDLHMEGWKFNYEFAGEDVLVLAGDIHTRNRHHELLDQVPNDVQILMVAGNHEYYHNDFDKVNAYLKMLENKYDNFKFLQNESIVLDGIDFFGGSMFTDFRLYGWKNLEFVVPEAQRCINDFNLIVKDNGKLWTTQDHVAEFNKFKMAFEAWLPPASDARRVVITHWVPTPQAIHPRFAGEKLNPYFTQDMEQYMGWNGLWLFGHTHDSYDIGVGKTRIVSNPRGYGTENHTKFKDVVILNY